MMNYAFVSKSAREESKKQIDDAMTMIKTPAVKGTMSLHAVIPISSGRTAVRDKMYVTGSTLALERTYDDA